MIYYILAWGIFGFICVMYWWRKTGDVTVKILPLLVCWAMAGPLLLLIDYLDDLKYFDKVILKKATKK